MIIIIILLGLKHKVLMINIKFAIALGVSLLVNKLNKHQLSSGHSFQKTKLAWSKLGSGSFIHLRIVGSALTSVLLWILIHSYLNY